MEMYLFQMSALPAFSVLSALHNITLKLRHILDLISRTVLLYFLVLGDSGVISLPYLVDLFNVEPALRYQDGLERP